MLISSVILFLFMGIWQRVWGLDDITLTIDPPVVHRHDHCTIRCEYDLDAPVYTVKYYRGPHEFYRYTPNEYPNTKVFPIGGIDVDVHNSNSTQVVLRNVEFNLSGNFSCEVTTESFTFATRMDTKMMLVVQTPDGPPVITVSEDILDYGDTLRANCTSPPSKPQTILSFILNNKTVASNSISIERNVKIPVESELSLELLLLEDYFTAGRLILRCEARIEGAFQQFVEIRLDSARDPIPERVSALGIANKKSSLIIIHCMLVLLLLRSS